jgi:Ca2+-binding EF-hand superfamily protein
MRAYFRLLGVLGAFICSATAQALPDAATLQTDFAGLDRSGNGAIDLPEWEEASFALFRAADRNNNNLIEPGEIGQDTAAENTFARADSDRDGRLSVDEFMQLRRAIFTAADIDRDDFLTPVEYELFRLIANGGWDDANRNGRIELSELRSSLTAIFRQADTDADGQLSATEAGFMPAADYAKATKAGPLDLAAFIADYRRRLIGE